jgi:diguanylate cyclase (GGDEF)-like protein
VAAGGLGGARGEETTAERGPSTLAAVGAPADDAAVTARSTLGRARRGRRHRLRTLLLLGIAVPLLGLGGLATVLVGERWADRDTSRELERQAAELGLTVEIRAALTEEEVHATVLALARDLGVTVDEVPGFVAAEERALLEEARARVDRLAADRPGVPSAAAMAELADLRRRFDRGTATYAEVSDLHRRISDEVEVRWRRQLEEIEDVADRRPLPAKVRRPLRALRETGTAFSQGGQRIRSGVALLLGAGSTPDLRDLLAATTRFEGAAQRAERSLGPRGTEAWRAFRADPAAQRIEANLDLAARVGLGEATTTPGLDIANLAATLADGSRWGILLTEVVQAASTDLAVAARGQVRIDTQAVGAAAGAALALSSVAVFLALLIARQLVRPAVALELGARRVEHGQFELDTVEVRGPREVRATVEAFNDMAATLAALEHHAVTLAEDPESPELDAPLPGRTGRAMQVAIDRLRASIRQAEEHRAELHELATRDGLTGLLNRTAALEAIARDLSRAQRDGTVLVALYVDLDGLKELNDAYGHSAGDEAIRRTADVLAATTRSADVVARLGGDEFLVAGVVPAGPPGMDVVRGLADRVHGAITAASVRVEDDVIPLRASVGVATTGPGTATVAELIRAADEALYTAKRAGRSQVAWHRSA